MKDIGNLTDSRPGEEVWMLHLIVIHVAAAVPGGSPSAPPGLSGGLSNLIDWGKWIASGVGLAGVLYSGGKLAHAHQSRRLWGRSPRRFVDVARGLRGDWCGSNLGRSAGLRWARGAARPRKPGARERGCEVSVRGRASRALLVGADRGRVGLSAGGGGDRRRSGADLQRRGVGQRRAASRGAGACPGQLVGLLSAGGWSGCLVGGAVAAGDRRLASGREHARSRRPRRRLGPEHRAAAAGFTAISTRRRVRCWRRSTCGRAVPLPPRAGRASPGGPRHAGGVGERRAACGAVACGLSVHELHASRRR